MKSSWVTKYSQYILWLVILLITIGTRFWAITNKPIHFDESINGWFVLQISKVGFYKYDPNNYHGPLYFYLVQIFELLWGRSVAILRAVPAVFSVLSVMVFTFGLLRSRSMQWTLLLLVMFSPAFLFFGRSGIHEMPFVFFQILFAMGLLRWGESSDNQALDLLLIGLFGMMTLKETFALTLVSFVTGFLFLGPQEWRRQLSLSKLRKAWTRGVGLQSALLLILFVGLYTGFLRNPTGLLDFFKAFLPWIKTGVGETGHNKEFLYWLKTLFAAEPLAAFGVFMAFVGLFMREAPLRLMSAFSLTHLLLYSLIPYKTVWCILSLVWGFYFVIALFLQKILVDREKLQGTKNNSTKLLVSFVTVLLLLFPLQLRSDYLAVYREPISFEHPYVYVNSTYELKDLQSLILKKLEEKPELREEIIQIGMKEQWPWPWVLRFIPGARFDNCWDRIYPDALVYFCDSSERLDVEGALTDRYLKITLSLRQSKEPSLVYLKKNIFDGSYHGDYELIGPERGTKTSPERGTETRSKGDSK